MASCSAGLEPTELRAQIAKALGGLRMLDGGRDFPVEALDHLARRFRGHEETVPAVGFQHCEARSTQCGGNELTVFYGMAKPVRAPRIGPARPY